MLKIKSRKVRNVRNVRRTAELIKLVSKTERISEKNHIKWSENKNILNYELSPKKVNSKIKIKTIFSVGIIAEKFIKVKNYINNFREIIKNK